jgi:3-(3-hydroxy-phenyl)propionate hydroxylase
MDRFRHGRVLFAGDSAHGVSPFGARGANSGVQDADNLAWKLAAVLKGDAPDALLDSYASEREYAADENIRHSTRATDFITPKSEVSRLFRDAVLELSKTQPSRARWSTAGGSRCRQLLRDSPLNTVDADAFDTRWCRALLLPMRRPCEPTEAPAGCCANAMASSSPHWSSARAKPPSAVQRPLKASDAPLHIVRVQGTTEGALATQRYDAQPGTVYLLRPDQHVCARWRQPTPANIRAAIDRALARA